MGYPEPIPTLKGKAAIEFGERLDNFKLTDEQKKFYEEAFDMVQCKSDCKGHYKFGQCVGCTRYPYQERTDKYEKGE